MVAESVNGPVRSAIGSTELVLPSGSWASNSGVRRSMQSNRPRNTRLEVKLRSALHARGLRFRKHLRPVPGLRCEADVVFPRRRVAVFIDGCFWHACPMHATWPVAHSEFWRQKIERTTTRDEANRSALEEAGWLVVGLWEHEPLQDMVRKVESVLATHRASTPREASTRNER
ncbi:MAG TPA: very short patch repair endonuclease [Chloroflexota bacterium]